MDEWKEILRGSLRTPDDLAERFGLNPDEIRKIARVFKTQITPYYASLIKEKGDPIWKQVVPDAAELTATPASPTRSARTTIRPCRASSIAIPTAALPRLAHVRLVLPVLHPQAQGRGRRQDQSQATSKTASTTSGPMTRSGTSSSRAATRSC